MSRWMMRKLRPLIFGIIFLPLVVRGGELQPFSLSVWVSSVAYQATIQEPFAEITVRSAGGLSSPLFQGFTNLHGWLELGLFTDLPQSLYVEVKRDRVDSPMQHTLPLVRCNEVQVGPREELWCHATYDYDQGTRECECDSW